MTNTISNINCLSTISILSAIRIVSLISITSITSSILIASIISIQKNKGAHRIGLDVVVMKRTGFAGFAGADGSLFNPRGPNRILLTRLGGFGSLL